MILIDLLQNLTEFQPTDANNIDHYWTKLTKFDSPYDWRNYFSKHNPNNISLHYNSVAI